ncbi:HAD-IA family hydrolase [Amycolatopsis sp. NBC_01307]|uniref:HAD family hydrolase n=1 Tax=Amycolatopsis sp. NBC_01307 TaxID=2903561 RepID=UPI002E1102DD|nr:HAD-IA family hydrolase [Amycolatopsis sp. NBC_01307]
MTPREIVRAARHILLDFDGPVCAVFSGISDRQAADALRAELTSAGVAYPESVARTRDPFEVLEFAVRVDQQVGTLVEQSFRVSESSAVRVALATDGTPDLLRRAAENDQLVTIVSNNSSTAVRQYLELAGLTSFVRGIAARSDAVIEHLKPSPFLLRQAMAETGTSPGDCVMIGDSVTDIEAAQAAGTKVIAYANKPGKRQRFEELSPDGVVESLVDL